MHSREFFNKLKAVQQTFVCDEQKSTEGWGSGRVGKRKANEKFQQMLSGKKCVIMDVQFGKPLSCDLIAAPFVSPPL